MDLTNYLNISPSKCKPLKIYPCLIKCTGSTNAAIFLSQMIYWIDKTNIDGGVYKTSEEIEEAIGLNRNEQEYARKKLIKLGVLSEKYERSIRKMLYRVDMEQIDRMIRISLI